MRVCVCLSVLLLLVQSALWHNWENIPDNVLVYLALYMQMPLSSNWFE